MNNRCHVLFALLLALAFSVAPAAADIDRAQAIDILHKVISPTNLKREVAGYLSLAPLSPGDKVVPFGDESRAFTVTTPVWFGYIDDDPSAFFVHNVRYVYIDAVTGKSRVVLQEWWPQVNDFALFSRDAVKAKPELRVFSTRDARSN